MSNLTSKQIQVTCVSPNYSPDKVVTRYVRLNAFGTEYQFCEVGEDSRYNIRSGVVIDPSIIPEEIKAKAKELQLQAFGYVVWPF